MSARTYQLRTRTDAGVATQQKALTQKILPARGPTMASNPATGPRPLQVPDVQAGPALYSDMAASRPPSPSGKETAVTSSSQAVANDLKRGQHRATLYE
jgi:hypothetical protein